AMVPDNNGIKDFGCTEINRGLADASGFDPRRTAIRGLVAPRERKTMCKCIGVSSGAINDFPLVGTTTPAIVRFRRRGETGAREVQSQINGGERCLALNITRGQTH